MLKTLSFKQLFQKVFSGFKGDFKFKFYELKQKLKSNLEIKRVFIV
jgi:hypothetical protein